MARYEYKIASNYDIDNGSMTYFEDIFTNAPRKKSSAPLPRGTRVPLGSVTRTAIDGSRRTDGVRIGRIFYDAVYFSHLDTYVTTYLGGWTTESAQVTVKLQDPDGTFTRYNALAYLPVFNAELAYRHVNNDWVANLELTFYIVGAAA